MKFRTFDEQAAFALSLSAVQRRSEGADRLVLAQLHYRDWTRWRAIGEHKAQCEALARLRYLARDLQFHLKYSPSQPRVPAGNPDGGQWTSGGGREEGSNDGTSFGEAPDGTPIEAAGDITGFTKHGINQAINRGVSPLAILDAIANPLQIMPQSDGRTNISAARLW